jgi:tetratricopeptide (TPR) repeat protein
MHQGRTKSTTQIGILFVGMLFAMLPNLASAKDKTPRDEAEAIQWAQEALKAGYYKNIRVEPQYILFSTTNNNFGIALARIVSTSTTWDKADGYPHSYVHWQDYAHDQAEYVSWSSGLLGTGGIGHSDKFKAALDFLVASARELSATQYANEFADFKPQAKAWREAATKLVMPDAAHEHQVLAEYAIKEKDTDKAIAEYAAALSVFPTWPEGQYNLATLAGEKKFYGMAILHMNEYLELTPDSPDAQAAKDSVIIWRDKLQTAWANSNIRTASGETSTQPKGAAFQPVGDKQK